MTARERVVVPLSSFLVLVYLCSPFFFIYCFRLSIVMNCNDGVLCCNLVIIPLALRVVSYLPFAFAICYLYSCILLGCIVIVSVPI